MTSLTRYNILSFFINYGENQTHYLEKILTELDSIENCNFLKIIFCTHLYNFKSKNIHQILLPLNIGVDLTLQPYIWLEKNKKIIDHFDYILYNENDNFISRENLFEFIHWNNFLEKHNKCCGFIRYEINNDGNKYIVDPDGILDQLEIDGIKFFTIKNIHSGCWLLSKKQYKQKIETNLDKIGITLEDRASNVYKSNFWPGTHWGIEKLFPCNEYFKLLIHHMPDKYTHILNSPHGKIKIENLLKNITP